MFLSDSKGEFNKRKIEIFLEGKTEHYKGAEMFLDNFIILT